MFEYFSIEGLGCRLSRRQFPPSNPAKCVLVIPILQTNVLEDAYVRLSRGGMKPWDRSSHGHGGCEGKVLLQKQLEVEANLK